MAMRNPYRGSIDAELDRLCRLRSGSSGRFVVEEVLNDFEGWLHGHPDVIALQLPQIARAAFDAFDRKRRPVSTKGFQLGLFRPEALIPTGKNDDGKAERVYMELATREDLVAWEKILTREFASSASAHATTQTYIHMRMSAWTADFDTLGELEAGLFGWQP